MHVEPRKRPFLRQFAALFLTGLLGVLTLPLLVAGQLVRVRQQPGFPDLPGPVLIALTLIQPAFLLAAGTAIGVALAHRLGLRSHIAEWARRGTPAGSTFRGEAPAAAAVGVAVAAVVVLLDLAFRAAFGDLALRSDQMPSRFAALIAGLLYGGLTEELIMRWGLLTLFAWLGWRLFQRSGDPPRAWVMWSAILVTALLFGAGHLPAVRSLVPLTALVVVRTVVLNALAGVVFGWLYWRRSLESAMLAHASGHLVFFLVNLLPIDGSG